MHEVVPCPMTVSECFKLNKKGIFLLTFLTFSKIYICVGIYEVQLGTWGDEGVFLQLKIPKIHFCGGFYDVFFRHS